MTTIRTLAVRLTARGLRGRNDEGQATAEYALVLLGVAAIALAVLSWATKTNLVGKLLDAVFSGLLHKVT
jgi:Flp pilus assembly pilin Flp